MTKVCSKCNIEKELDNFSKDSKRSDGYYPSCKKCRKIYSTNKPYNKDKHDNRKTQQMDYYRKNKEKHSKYKKDRRITDSLFKLKDNIRSLVGISMRNLGYSKTSKTQDIVGLDYESLKNWLEYSYFLNYGTDYADEKVEIDHIIPVSTAKTEEEVLKLNHYTNLQYLTPEDNRLKGDRYGY